MVDNIKEIVKLWRAQYRSLQDTDEKMVMLTITVSVQLLILLFAVVIIWTVIAFIKVVWPFLLALTVIFGVIKLMKGGSK